MADTHALVASVNTGRRDGKFHRVTLMTFYSYDAALAAWSAADAARADFPKVASYAVRSVEDPEWQRSPQSFYLDPNDLFNSMKTRNATREWRRKELGKLALAFVKDANPGDDLWAVVRKVRECGNNAGLDLIGPEVTDAVKARVTIGRCQKALARWGGGGCGRAFWFPKNEGRLHEKECPHCKLRLGQTTLALRAAIARYPKEAS